jgi:PKD repeat protein
MKTKLLTSFILLMMGSAALAQENAASYKQLAPVHSSPNTLHQVAACGPDTILYPYLKELAFASPNDSFFVDAMVGSVRTASQAYHNSNNINILGVQFWGGAYSTSTAPQTLLVRAYLYSVDASNMPVAAIDSATILVTEAYGFYEANFAVPHAYSQNFAVAVRSIPNDTLAVITNNAGNVWTPNYSESLAWRRFGSGTWNSALSFFGQDLEYMIFPIVDYSITASFNSVNDTACIGDPQVFTNLSSSIFSNRFLNLYAFDEYWGFAVADSSFTWNYGDNATWTSSNNGAHTYSTSGTYDVQLTGTMVGYYSICTDTFSMSMEVMPPVLAGFTYDNSAEPTIAFTNASTGAASYMWDFGDSATSTSSNPSHIYSATGTYTVTLITTGFCGTDTSTQVITITTTGIQDATPGQPAAFFQSSDQSLNVTLPVAADALIEVYSLAGDLIYSEDAINTTTKKISMSGAAAGVYMVRVLSGDEISTIKFAVTK